MSKLQHILVIRFSSIGDILLTSPVVRCIKQTYPDAQVHFLTKKSFAELVSYNPTIAEVHLWTDDNTDLIKTLKEISFDVVIDLHNNLRTTLLKSKLGVPAHKFPKLNVQKWLYVNFKVNRMPDVHIVDRYFEAVKPIGVINDGKPLDVIIPSSQQINPTDYFEGKPYLAVAVGAQFATKRLPIEKLIAILKQVDYPIVLLGGPTDVAVGNQIETALNRSNLLNQCGKLSLLTSASVVAHAQVLLTHDTGLMHVASAFDTNIVSVWGNTTPALGMYPYRPTNKESYVIHEVENLSCRPCSKIGYNTCPKNHFNCMQLQDEKAIVSSIISFISINSL